jgi:hypothetical protein
MHTLNLSQELKNDSRLSGMQHDSIYEQVSIHDQVTIPTSNGRNKGIFAGVSPFKFTTKSPMSTSGFNFNPSGLSGSMVTPL